MNKNRIINFLHENKIYLFIITAFFLTSIFILVMGTGYWYDEIIVTEISRQPLSQLFNTVLAEPHSPGFYLLLKLLPIYNYVFTRIAVSFVSTMLLLLVVFYGKKTGVINKYKLDYGIILFLCSPFWNQMYAYIKQDAITIPLLILAIFISLNYLEKKSTSSLALLAFVSLITLIFGYINFIKIFLILVLCTFYKPKIKNFIPLLSSILVIIFYVITFGKNQFLTNIGRFTWQNGQYQNIISAIYTGIGGQMYTKETFFIADIFFILSIVLITSNNIYKKQRINKFLIFLYFGIIILYFLVIGVARYRYIADIFILYFIPVGWGLFNTLEKTINKHLKILIYFGITLYFIYGTMEFYTVNQSVIVYKNQNIYLEQLIGTHPTGLIERHPISPFIRKQGYLKNNPYIIPIRADKPINSTQTITKELLQQDGEFIELSKEKVINNLYDTGLNRFIYLSGNTKTKENLDKYYDPNQKILIALEAYCQKKESIFKNYLSLVVFDGCGNYN